MLKNKRIYKFDYGNKFNLIFSYFIEAFENIGTIIMSFLLLFIISQMLSDLLTENIYNIVLRLLLIIVCAIDLFILFMIFIPKKIVITNDKIIVKRFCFSLTIFPWDIRGLNDNIYLDQIISCEKDNKPCFSDIKMFFKSNNESLVRIKTNNKSYLMPVKDAETFVNEVNSRINSMKG